MSLYERRFHYSTKNRVSVYTDDTSQVFDAIQKDWIATDSDGVGWISDGYADYEDVPEGPGQIGGTMITRRTERVYSSDDFIRVFGPERDARQEAKVVVERVLAMIEDAEDLLKIQEALREAEATISDGIGKREVAISSIPVKS